jgi:hypothetical protein
MIALAGLLFALTLLACPSPPAADPVPSPARVEPQPTPPIEHPPIEIEASTPDAEPTPPPKPEREVIRRRCKQGFSACNGGRECCNDLLEVCAPDNHCRPFE